MQEALSGRRILGFPPVRHLKFPKRKTQKRKAPRWGWESQPKHCTGAPLPNGSRPEKIRTLLTHECCRKGARLFQHCHGGGPHDLNGVRSLRQNARFLFLNSVATPDSLRGVSSPSDSDGELTFLNFRGPHMCSIERTCRVPTLARSGMNLSPCLPACAFLPDISGVRVASCVCTATCQLASLLDIS